MWQEIIENAKTALTGDIKNKTGIDQQQAQQSVEMAGESTREVLTDEAKKGNIQQIVDLFSNRKPSNSSNPITDKIGGSLISKLTNRLGLSKEAATSVERMVVPFILNMLNKRTGGSGSAPSAQNIFSMLGGSDSLGGGIQDKIKKGLGGLF
jgi:nucleoid DNA-binding protein